MGFRPDPTRVNQPGGFMFLFQTGGVEEAKGHEVARFQRTGHPFSTAFVPAAAGTTLMERVFR